MQSSLVINSVSCHAEGEVGDVIINGVSNIPGKSMLEKSKFIAKDKKLRNFLLNEPRGGVFRHVNLILPPLNKKADFGWIIMEPEDTPPMSGSNAICVSTVLIETGMVKIQEPETKIILDAPGGLIEAKAKCKNGRVEIVSIKNLPSFVDQLNATLELDGFGTLKVDTAFGGDTFVIVDANQLNFSLKEDEARDISEIGLKIIKEANKQLEFKHHKLLKNDSFSFCQFSGKIKRKKNILSCQNAVVIRPGKIDRSPCGTGCSAKMATLSAKGILKKDDIFIGESIINSKFYCKILHKNYVNGKEYIIPEISGRAWITGTHQHMLDPLDPWPNGYRLSDTWPKTF